MGLKIAVCDDEITVGSIIKSQILKIRADYSIEIFQSGEQLLSAKDDFDLIFLDIEMSGKNGIEIASRLRKMKCESIIIFLTSHTEYMPDAFKVKAFRFLDKPIDEQKFCEALISAEKELLGSRKMAVTSKSGMEIIRLNDIICFEAFGDGTYIHTKHEIIESPKPLKYWTERMYGYNFFQVHKSFLISLKYVKKIGRSNAEMGYMKQPVPVSRRKQTRFKDAFFEYVRKNAQII